MDQFDGKTLCKLERFNLNTMHSLVGLNGHKNSVMVDIITTKLVELQAKVSNKYNQKPKYSIHGTISPPLGIYLGTYMNASKL